MSTTPKSIIAGVVGDFVYFTKLGGALKADAASEIQSAAASGWRSDRAQVFLGELRDFLGFVSKAAIYLSLAVFIPLLPVIAFLVLGLSQWWASAIYVAYAVWVILIAFVSLWVLWPFFSVARFLRELPSASYRELVWPMWLTADALVVLINVALFTYVYRMLEAGAALPVFVMLALAWLFGPWVAHIARRDVAFIWIRLLQLLSLLVFVLVLVASPIPMRRFQWWAHRKAAEAVRPFEGREVTAEWETLKWFTPEGEPNVWFSHTEARGYRLFSAPQYDQETGRELRPVSDEATKDSIVAHFARQRAALARQVEAEDRKRQAEAREESERAGREARDRLIRQYVLPDAVGGAAKARVALVAFGPNRQADLALAMRLSEVLAAGGMANSTEVFTPAFVASPEFGAVLAGSAASEGEFRAADFARGVISVGETATYGGQTTQGADMRTADVSWSVRVVSLADARTSYSRDIRARGVGFGDSDALRMARERAEAQLSAEVARMPAKQ